MQFSFGKMRELNSIPRTDFSFYDRQLLPGHSSTIVVRTHIDCRAVLAFGHSPQEQVQFSSRKMHRTKFDPQNQIFCIANREIGAAEKIEISSLYRTITMT